MSDTSDDSDVPDLVDAKDSDDEEVLSLEQLRDSNMNFFLPIIVLSYGWAAKSHPDPTGAHLRSLVPVLRAMLKACDDGLLPFGRLEQQRPRAWGVVWDFMSLPQRGYTSGYDPACDDRTPYQIQRFG